MKNDITKIAKIIKGSLDIAFLLAIIFGTIGILGLSLYFRQNLFMSIASFKLVLTVFALSFIAKYMLSFIFSKPKTF